MEAPFFYTLTEQLLTWGQTLHYPVTSLNELQGLFHQSVSGGELEIVRELVNVLTSEEINSQDDKGQTALSIALKLLEPKRGEIIKLLLNHGANANIPDIDGNLPLHLLALESRECYSQTFEILAQYTKDLNANNFDGLTALAMLVFRDRVNSVKFLIEKIDRVNFDFKRLNLLHLATQTIEGNRSNPEIMKLLLPKCSDLAVQINAQEEQTGRTPLHYAAGTAHKEIVELLLVHGAKTNILDCEQKSPKDFAQRHIDRIKEARKSKDPRITISAWFNLYLIPILEDIIRQLDAKELIG